MNKKGRILNLDIIEAVNSKGTWTNDEHNKMILFMQNNRQELNEHIQINIEYKSRSNKSRFFTAMANYIGTKNVTQCKSRYQKKEEILLRCLDFPDNLIDKYFRVKGERARNLSFKKRNSVNSTQVSNSMVKQDEPTSSEITSFVDLKSLILSECMPKIQNQVVKSHLEYFLKNLPVDDDIIEYIPMINFSSIEEINSQLIISFEDISIIDILPSEESDN